VTQTNLGMSAYCTGYPVR